MSFLETISIVRAVPEDVCGIQELLYVSELATYPSAEHRITAEDIERHYEDRHNPNAIEWRRAQIASPKSGEHKFVAKSNGDIIGACFANCFTYGNELHVLYVHPDHFRKGIGSMLWKAAEATLDEKKGTTLGVAAYNRRAIAFYKRHGFAIVGPVNPDRAAIRNGKPIPVIEMEKPGRGK